jgi:hypothetical protein
VPERDEAAPDQHGHDGRDDEDAWITRVVAN